MGIFQGDIKIRTAITLTLEEMRKNIWLLDDVFSDLLEDPYLADYGAKEVAKAKEWFLNNKIEVLHKLRPDSQDYPCVTINIGPSPEDDREATLADLSPYTEELTPEQIGKPIPYIVKPFTPASYVDGVVRSDSDLGNVSPGMLAVDPETGNAWEITEIVGSDGFRLKDAPEIQAEKIGVIPQYRVYRARRERAAFRETYHIGCHAHGDPNQLIWLWSIVLYGLLRYRESLIASRSFQISSLQSSDMMREDAFEQGGENAYKRYITLTGLVQNSWLKSPKRIIEIAKLQDPDGVSTGVKVLTNTDTPVDAADPERDDTWLTKQETQSFTKKRIVKRN
jgi:hypothetical protein